MKPTGIELANFCLVAQFLNQVHLPVPHFYLNIGTDDVLTVTCRAMLSIVLLLTQIV